ncbi:hypothetical protein [Deinococcus aquaticus]|uniref:hypothetical protein n=1 Tax=Deinococcus aquaticus TaxID=328692 RepID=UPI00360D68B2
MSIFDERLRRLKHASQMAVTQRDHPRSDAALAAIPTPPTPLSPWSPALPSRPGGAQPSGAVAITRSGPRRVTARLLSAPSGPAGPDDLTDWPPAAQPEWNAQPSLDAPLLTEARRSPAPPPGPAAAQPSPAPRPPASPLHP